MLSMTFRDYSLSEISRLVEENDAKIISLYVMSAPDTTEIDVTIKLNVFDLAPISEVLRDMDIPSKHHLGMMIRWSCCIVIVLRNL